MSQGETGQGKSLDWDMWEQNCDLFSPFTSVITTCTPETLANRRVVWDLSSCESDLTFSSSGSWNGPTRPEREWANQTRETLLTYHTHPTTTREAVPWLWGPWPYPTARKTVDAAFRKAYKSFKMFFVSYKNVKILWSQKSGIPKSPIKLHILHLAQV